MRLHEQRRHIPGVSRSRGSTKIFAIDRRLQAKSLLRLASDDLVVAMPKSCADVRRHASAVFDCNLVDTHVFDITDPAQAMGHIAPSVAGDVALGCRLALDLGVGSAVGPKQIKVFLSHHRVMHIDGIDRREQHADREQQDPAP